MCGEKRKASSLDFEEEGSPPHVRGKAHFSHKSFQNIGITPACAGKRLKSSERLKTGWDHPRMCGEKLCFSLIITYKKGSPPHVRRKGLVCGWYDHRHGITPACAGKSISVNCVMFARWDHPRMCGEKVDFL